MNDDAFLSGAGMVAGEVTAAYSVEVMAELAGEESAGVLRYYEMGLISAAAEVGVEGEAALVFDDESLRQLRRLGYLRENWGLSEAGLQLVSGLLGEVEALRGELRRR